MSNNPHPASCAKRNEHKERFLSTCSFIKRHSRTPIDTDAKSVNHMEYLGQEVLRVHVSCTCRIFKFACFSTARRVGPIVVLKRCVISFVVLFVAWTAASAREIERLHDEWTAICLQVKGFHDGDTLTCVSDSQGPFVIRFAGIDAPETGQAYWRVSREKLREAAGPGTAASCYKQDQYGRQVCRLKSSSGKDLADTMLAEGLAWHAVRFAEEQTSEERERYARLEAEAKASRRGLWVEPNPMPPGECRQLRRKHQKCR